MAWMILLKKFGPYLGIVLLVFGVWMHGKSVGVKKWRGKYNESERVVKVLTLNLNQCSAENALFRDVIDANNEAVRIMGEEHDERVRRARLVAERILNDQATVYQRKLREAAAETRSLRESMRTMGVAESCHEAFLEVLR